LFGCLPSGRKRKLCGRLAKTVSQALAKGTIALGVLSAVESCA